MAVRGYSTGAAEKLRFSTVGIEPQRNQSFLQSLCDFLHHLIT